MRQLKPKPLFGVAAIALCAVVGCLNAGWWRTYGDEGYEMGKCVQITSDGNYIISGAKNDSLWLIKTDTAGEVIWERTYGRSDGLRSRWLEETSDGGYIIAPRTPSLLKVNAQGDSLWAHDYDMYSYCSQETSDNGYIVVGGELGYASNRYLILVKTNSSGGIIWTQTYGDGVDRHTGFFIDNTNDGGFIITGRTGPQGEEYTSKALWLVKTNSQGDTLWTKEYGQWGSDEKNSGFCVRQTDDRGYIIVGYRDFGDRGLWLLKTDSLGLLSIVEDTLPQIFNNWNVISALGQNIMIQYSDCPQGFQADVFDALGRKVGKIHSEGASGSIYWGENQTPGVYFMQDKINNRVQTAKVVLVK